MKTPCSPFLPFIDSHYIIFGFFPILYGNILCFNQPFLIEWVELSKKEISDLANAYDYYKLCCDSK